MQGSNATKSYEVTEIAECERLGHELEVARQAYDQLFPCRPRPVAGLDYCGANRPALEVGGDYFDFLDFLSRPSPKLGIAIGDISGKGIPAAMQMPILRTSLRALIICPQASLAGLVTNLGFFRDFARKKWPLRATRRRSFEPDLAAPHSANLRLSLSGPWGQNKKGRA